MPAEDVEGEEEETQTDEMKLNRWTVGVGESFVCHCEGGGVGVKENN